MQWLRERWAQWLANSLAAAVVVLAIFFCFQSAQNRSLQDQANAARVQLTRAQTLTNLDSGLIQLIAKTTAEKNDAALQALLAHNGVTFKVEPKAAAAPSSASASRTSE